VRVENPPLLILAISGSLRRGSSNTAVLRAAGELAPAGVEIALYDAMASLPAFNPDLDDNPPPAAAEFRAALQAADGVLISSPEYAHGVSGMLKNALDWVVGSSELVDKPVALINASPRATIAQAALCETLTTMSAALVSEASIALPLLGRVLPPGGIAADPEIAGPLRVAVQALASAIQARRAGVT